MIDGNHSAKVVGKLLRRKSITFEGSPLTARDSATMRHALAFQGGLLRDLLSCEGAWRRWCAFLGEPDLDVKRLSDTIKFADGVLKQYPADEITNDQLFGGVRVCRDVCSFKRCVRDRKLLWSFLAPMEDVWASYFKDVQVSSFRVLNEWVNFLSHITLRDVDLKSPLIREYIELEQVEGEWVYGESTLSCLNAIMAEWLEGFDLQEFHPSHGPGAVSELRGGTGRLAKYEVMGTDVRLDYWFRRIPAQPWELLPPGGFSSVRVLDRTSELICVPKSMTKNRTISKEPCSLQYFQHGVQRRVDEYMREHPVLQGRIDLHDQSLSQELARLGSVRGEWDTIDLSAASDSVTLSLVKAVFAHTPLYRSLVCLRSDRTRLPDGSLIQLEKFAPMGSDLCFPTMCLVFACVCEYAVRKTSGRRSRLNDYRVYGDDIVLRREFTKEVLALLGELHFKVNSAKSFTEQAVHNFREACGGEYLDGVEVEPIRISRRLRVECEVEDCVSSVEAVSSFVELANAMLERGYLRARGEILSSLKGTFDRYAELPYTTEVIQVQPKYGRSCYMLPTTTTTIRTFPWCCTNFRVRHRFSGANGKPGLHVQQYYVCCAKTTEENPVRRYRDTWTSEDVRYFEYWLTLPDRPYVEEFGVIITPDPVSGLYPCRQDWRKAWISAKS